MVQQSSSVTNTKDNTANGTPYQGTEDAGKREKSSQSQGDNQSLTAGIKDLASSVAGEARHAVEDRLGSQKSRIGEGIGGVVQALRQVGGARQQPQLAPALIPYIDKAADQMEKVSQYFDSKNLGEMAHDVESYARREPIVFLGGAFMLGLLGGRFLKATRGAGDGGGYAREDQRSEGQAERGEKVEKVEKVEKTDGGERSREFSAGAKVENRGEEMKDKDRGDKQSDGRPRGEQGKFDKKPMGH